VMTAQVVQALSGHAWLALLSPALPMIHLVWLRVRTRINIHRFRTWDCEAQEIGMSKTAHHKLFANAARRDLHLRDGR
jgi:hypothetical protein